MLLRRKAKTPPPQPLRTGLYQAEIVGAGLLNKNEEFRVSIEVAEWERLGSKSRVSVISISGVPRSYTAAVRDIVGTWVETKEVIWRADGEN